MSTLRKWWVKYLMWKYEYKALEADFMQDQHTSDHYWTKLDNLRKKSEREYG